MVMNLNFNEYVEKIVRNKNPLVFKTNQLNANEVLTYLKEVERYYGKELMVYAFYGEELNKIIGKEICVEKTFYICCDAFREVDVFHEFDLVPYKSLLNKGDMFETTLF